jgi:hypothetical protein
VNRFQILKGEKPPPKEQSTGHYFYGVDWGSGPNNTAVAICHHTGIQNIVQFDYTGLLADSSADTPEVWITQLSSNYSVRAFTVDHPFFMLPKFSGLTNYRSIICTMQLRGKLNEGFSCGCIAPLANPAVRNNIHIFDAMALAYYTLLMEIKK